MKLPVLLLCALASFVCSANGYAGTSEAPLPQETQQAKTRIQGVVTDENGHPLIGASVVEKGTEANGIVTDVDGRFVLTLHSAHASITVSYIGYQSQTLKAVAGKDMKIILQEDAALLDEVMVVAFGKQTRESFTGSAGVIKSDAIAQRQVSNPIAALNGKIAGVQMVEGNGPNAEASIVIRGVGSINSSTAPLIVLDGLPYNGYWNDINPADIESVTVQKDAASNALYGARGSGGVILVTTKNAQRGKAQISLDAKWGVNSDARVLYDYIDDPGQYYETYYKAMFNKYYYGDGQSFYNAHRAANQILSGESASGGLEYMVYDVPDGQYLIGENGRLNPKAQLGHVVTGKDGRSYTLLPDNWRKEGLRNGLRQEYNLSVNGGNDQFQFYGSLGYLNNEGLTYGSNYSRYTARLKADYQARPWLRIGGSLSYTHNESDALEEAFDIAYSMSPIFPLYLRDGKGNIMTDARGKMFDYGDSSTGLGLNRASYQKYNALQNDLIDVNNNNSNAFNLQGYADIMFLKDFKLTVNASVFDTENRITSALNPYYGIATTYGGYVSAYHYRTFALNLQQLLTWNKTFGEHNVSLLLGHEYERDPSTGTGGDKTRLYSYEMNKELDGAIQKTSISGYYDLYNVEGYFLRGLYDYKDTYYLSFSYRRDGSSRFHPDHRWGNFWSVGGSWIVTNEKWLNADWVNMLKLKASYGEVGNDGITAYSYTDTYKMTSSNNLPSYSFYYKGKEDISWEKIANFNVGVEFELFNKRLSGGIEYYSRKTSDMLLWFTAPFSLGYSGYYDNVGDMVNRGVEIELNADIIRNRLMTWSVNLNLAHNKNKVTYLPDENKSLVVDGVPGYANTSASGGSFYQYVGEGVPLYTYYMPRYAGVSANGESMWYYTAEDGSLATTTIYDSADYYLCGDPNPKVTGGFGTNLTIAGFDLSMNFLYSVGGKVYDMVYRNQMASPYGSYVGYNFHKDILNAWTPENTDSNIPRFQYGDTYTNADSDRWLIDGSSLTFKNISLGYTLPKSVSRKLMLSKLRIYVACDNVAYWSKRKGLDPRVSLTGNPSTYSYYSPMRTISGGINIQF